MRIQSLTLHTANLAAQKQFYQQILSLPIVDEKPHSIAFKIGHSILKLEERSNSQAYHFAINIPANQEKAALEWLKARVSILTAEGLEIQDFDFWNAKAIYFYDADNNIVEFIARKNLDNHSTTPFDQNALLEISEMGIPTNDVAAIYHQLHGDIGLPQYSGDLERFCAIGTETGLFICVNYHQKNWFPTGEVAHPADFEMQLLHNGLPFEVIYQEEALLIKSTI